MNTESEKQYITRLSSPNQLDQLPKNTIIKVVATNNNMSIITYYQQKNLDDENPKWDIIDDPTKLLD